MIATPPTRSAVGGHIGGVELVRLRRHLAERRLTQSRTPAAAAERGALTMKGTASPAPELTSSSASTQPRISSSGPPRNARAAEAIRSASAAPSPGDEMRFTTSPAGRPGSDVLKRLSAAYAPVTAPASGAVTSTR